MQKGEIQIYKTNSGTKIQVNLDVDTVWLSQLQLMALYQSRKAKVSEHIKHILEEEELIKEATIRKFRTVQKEGNRNVGREIEYYNLDMIISLGYRIKPSVATQFRIWATQRLKEHLVTIKLAV